MELFTLGIGNYTEKDVKEAARVPDRLDRDRRDSSATTRRRHDDGEKTILGTTGKWTGDDLVEMLLRAPGDGRGGWPGGCAKRFMGERRRRCSRA